MKRTNYILSVLLAFVVVGIGCDRASTDTSENTDRATRTRAETAPTAKPGTWQVGQLRVEQGAAPGNLELPDEATVSSWLAAAIEDAARLESTDAESKGFVSYRAAVVDGVAGVPAADQPLMRIRIQGQLSDPERPEPINELMALGIERDRSLDGEGEPSEDQTRELLKEVVEEYVAIVEARFSVLSATEGELVELLRTDTLPPEAVLTAVHEARDRNVDVAVPSLIDLLDHTSPTVVVAAAAALTQMAPDKSATGIVEAAGRLGREREYASLHRLIFIVGDLDAPVAREYLQGLTGHKIPDIRRAAQQVLDRKPVDTSRGGP